MCVCQLPPKPGQSITVKLTAVTRTGAISPLYVSLWVGSEQAVSPRTRKKQKGADEEVTDEGGDELPETGIHTWVLWL